MTRIATALGVRDPALGLYDLARKLAAPASLREIGMPESGIDQAADLAVTNPYWNPRAVEREAIRELIARAWRGDAVQSTA
jgi:maleylacetate reductase